LAPGERPELLQRLDEPTSGIVCAALTPQAARDFRAAEAAGICEKRYLALLTGELAAPVTARAKLDTRDRRVTRLLAAEAGPLRRTEILPLHIWRGEEAARLLARLGVTGALPAGTETPAALTLAACRIRRGSRHQIRAHAAGLGHALLGDGRYAPAGAPPAFGERFFLHHGLLAWPGYFCAAPAPWPWLGELLPATAWGEVRAWFSPEASRESVA
ncbi:MAG: RNA pseudouridine synthase, partial [Desulfovibrio sp.]|nr:RNA pseudouridine synthase [Desulfovibrio sp.]